MDVWGGRWHDAAARRVLGRFDPRARAAASERAALLERPPFRELTTGTPFGVAEGEEARSCYEASTARSASIDHLARPFKRRAVLSGWELTATRVLSDTDTVAAVIGAPQADAAPRSPSE